MKTRTFKTSPAHRSQGRLLGETGAYLFGSFLYFWKSKWGISDKTATRRAQVDKDVAGVVFCVFSREILFGWHCEQLVHWLYQWQNAPMRKGTGRSEWFLNFNPCVFAVMLWLTWRNGALFDWYFYLPAWLPFVWLDGLLWLLLFRFLNWMFAVAMLWAIDLLLKLGLCEFAANVCKILYGWAAQFWNYFF